MKQYDALPFILFISLTGVPEPLNLSSYCTTEWRILKCVLRDTDILRQPHVPKRNTACKSTVVYICNTVRNCYRSQGTAVPECI